MRLSSVIVLAIAVVCNLEFVSGFGMFDDIALTVRNALINLKELIESPARRRKIKELRRARISSHNSVKTLRESAVDITAVSKIAQYREPDVITLNQAKQAAALMKKPTKELIPRHNYKYNRKTMINNRPRYFNRSLYLSKTAYLANKMTWPRKESNLSRLLANITALYSLRHPKTARGWKNITKTTSEWVKPLPIRAKTWSKRKKASKMFRTTPRRVTTASLSPSDILNPLLVIGLSQSKPQHSTNHPHPAAINNITASDTTTSDQMNKTSTNANSKRATSVTVPILNPSKQRESFSEWLQRLHSEKRQKLKAASGGILFNF